MKAVRSLRVKKAVVDWGVWTDGRMPASAFPLSRGRSYRLALGWKWSVYRLTGDGHTFRLLVAFDPAKQQFQAWLGVEKGADHLLVGRVEFHDSHGGWHCHWKAGPLNGIIAGVVRSGSMDRTRNCSGERLSVSEMDALGIAFRLFNVETTPAIEEGALL